MQSIGRVFTPQTLAKTALELTNFLDNWQEDSRLFDPAAGAGHLLYAAKARLQSFDAQIAFQSLSGVELQPTDTDPLIRIEKGDFFDTAAEGYTHIFTNPPWVTFQDLPQAYKTKAKEIYRKYLKLEPAQLLLGLSRAELAGPFIIKTLQEHCMPGTRILAFLPASLFFGLGANTPFLRALDALESLRLKSVWDLGTAQAFPEVATRALLVYWELSTKPSKKSAAVALRDLAGKALGFVQEDPLGWCITQKAQWSRTKIEIKSQPPRQGINSCGANRIFFHSKKPFTSQHFYPLYDLKNHQQGQPPRWVLLPHHKETGKALASAQIETKAWEYLLSHKETLASRKGTLIQSMVVSGTWWALQGVGPYTFAPYKVVWRALGASRFEPHFIEPLDGLPLIPHQALYAYLSFHDRQEAEEAWKILQDPRIEEALQEQQGAGTMNFAQPGRIKSILDFT